MNSSMGVSFQPANQGVQKAGQDAQLFEQVRDTALELLNDMSDEMAAFSGKVAEKEIKGKKSKQQKTLKNVKQEVVQQQQSKKGKIETQEQKQQMTEFLTKGEKQEQGVSAEKMGAFAALIEDEKLKKARKKPKLEFEKKLELLASLEDDFNTIDLNPEDKEVVDQFFDKMGRIKHLKARLRQLENIERRHQEKAEEQEKREKEGKGQGQKEQEKEEPKKEEEKEEKERELEEKRRKMLGLG
ncbi:hypothetical protein ACFL2K_02430 [Candidatus Margulisiibacteriota bacterium]